MPRTMTQKDMLYREQRKIGEKDSAFMHMMTGPNPLTPEEVDKLIAKRPAVYGRYAGFGTKQSGK